MGWDLLHLLPQPQWPLSPGEKAEIKTEQFSRMSLETDRGEPFFEPFATTTFGLSLVP